MKPFNRLAFGPLAALLLGVGLIGLATTVPGYSAVRQTVSEIGETGSPARVPFAVLLCATALCLLVFASGVAAWARGRGRSGWPALFIALMAIPAAGVGLFAYPHPLHNVFGVGELVGYQAPLVLALTWRGDPEDRTVVTFSAIMAGVVWLAILCNLTTFHRSGALWAEIRPYYGLIQRSLFVSWFVWATGLDVRVSVFNDLEGRVCKFCARGSRRISHLFAVSVGSVRPRNRPLDLRRLLHMFFFCS